MTRLKYDGSLTSAKQVSYSIHKYSRPHQLVLALPASQHTKFVYSRGKAGGLTNMYSRDHQPFLASIQTRTREQTNTTRETTRPSSRADKHALARPPALQTNTHSRDHQPFLASRQTRTRETTSPSSRADQHVLARPPGLPREQTNTFSRDHQAFLARPRTRTRERAASHSRDSRTYGKPYVTKLTWSCERWKKYVGGFRSTSHEQINTCETYVWAHTYV